jgi:hypothetical protein
MMLETERPEMPDEPSPGIPPDPDQEGEDTGTDSEVPGVAPIGPTDGTEAGRQGDGNYGISA